MTAVAGHAFTGGGTAGAVEVEVDALDGATWRLTAWSAGRSPVVGHLVAGARGVLLVDPGSAVTWPWMLRALASVGKVRDVRWIFGSSALPVSLGALPLIESTIASDIMVVASAELVPMVSHYVTRMPIHVLAPGGSLDIGGRRLVAEHGHGVDGANVFVLRDTRSGIIFGGEGLGGEKPIPGQLASVQSALQTVLLTTLAPNALEGRALAALAPLGRVTAVRTYLHDGDTWVELGGRDGLRGRAVTQPPPPGHTTVRIELNDPAPIVLDFTFAEESASLVEDPDVRRLAESLRDPLASSLRRVLSLRESALANSRLRRDAQRDPLTGVRNRRALKAWTGTGRFAVLMIDLDRFKQVNDEHGHQSGDTVLRRVAEVISSQIRDQDLLIRYGGDEFLLLLDGVDSAAATALADRIRTSVSTPHAKALTPAATVTVSIGVAEGIPPLAEVIARADSAMYMAKAKGRDTVCVAP